MSQRDASVDGTALPLAGQRVLVTRPAHQAGPIYQRLSDLGAEPIPFPTLQIVPVTESDSGYQALKHCILNLDQYHSVIFVSANAVRLAHQWIDQYWPQLPLNIDWLAVGSATARMLQQCDLPVSNLQPADTAMNSEALLQRPQLQHLSSQKVLICRGQGGRELLGDTLQQRGAQVDYVELYHREIPVYSQAEIESIIYKSAASAMLVTSGEALTNLVTLTGGETAGVSTLTGCMLIVPSQRVAELAAQYQFKQIQVAANATDEAMLAALTAVAM